MHAKKATIFDDPPGLPTQPQASTTIHQSNATGENTIRPMLAKQYLFTNASRLADAASTVLFSVHACIQGDPTLTRFSCLKIWTHLLAVFKYS